MATYSFLLWICVALLTGAQGARWNSSSPPDGYVMYACVDDTVSILWEYILDSGDVLNEITWLFDGHSQEMVAFLSHEQFVVLPAFSNRVRHVGFAGISLSSATVGDSGNYSVEVQVFQQPGNILVTMRRRVMLQITDGLLTTDGVLHAFQNSQAVLDADTNQLSIELRCGAFAFDSNPPFTMEWVTPSDHKVNSTGFEDHYFTLLLNTPVKGGNYTCRIPAHHRAQACLHGNAGHQGEATVAVDKFESRLLLLEAENKRLMEMMVDTNSTLSLRLEKVEATSRPQIAFHATYLSSQHPPAGTALVFAQVHLNQGHAYNASSGVFTAPLPGIYYFVATTGGEDSDTYARHDLYADSTLLGTGHTYDRGQGMDYALASVHGAVRLTTGQRVYVRSDGSAYLGSDLAMFTGFLVTADDS